MKALIKKAYIKARHLLVAPVLLLCAVAALAMPRHSPVPGGVAVIELPGTVTQRPKVSFDERQQPVVQQKGKWFALVGLPLDTQAGEKTLVVEHAGKAQELSLHVSNKTYPAEKLRFSNTHMVTPPPELAARIEEEMQRGAAWRRHYSDEPEPDTRFDLPAQGPRSSRFGTQRVMNGQARPPHSGLDVAVGTGTPLRAPAVGTVLAVADFYFGGNIVLIDHGRGVLTFYAHLSRVNVVAGQKLARGEVFGLSGATGRITGPHLHWGVVVGGVYVDPELFLPPEPQKRSSARR